MRDHLTLEGQEEYEMYPEVHAQIFDLKQSKRPIPDELRLNSIYQCKLSCTDKDGNELRTRDFPSINAFPVFDLKKESKMWLTSLASPNEDQVKKVKDLVKNLVREFGPKSISIPAREAVLSLGPNLYSDGHVSKPDYEKPEHTWTSSWDYQRFKTDPRTEREVWLPPKGYKMCSSWWHFFAEPIMERIPWVVGNDTLTELRKDLHKRFTPCRKIDLKGFGLQFPREYLICTMEVLNELYPCEETQEYMRSTKAIFGKLSIKMDDGYFVTPNRGVGLGYFSNLMTLVVAAILQSCNIVKMFNDDILCPEETFEKALEELKSLSFVINEEKTGKKWYKVPFFAGASLAPKGTLRYYEAQGEVAAIFQRRFHYQRKSILSSIILPSRWKAAYHYERIFGSEYSPGESFLHPEMWGVNPLAPRTSGYVTGGLLRKAVTPKHQDEEQRRLWSIMYPWKVAKPSKEFSMVRRTMKRKAHLVHYTEYEEYLNPRIEEPKDNHLGVDFFLGKYQLPRWADLQNIIWNQQTTGRTTMGTYPKRAAYGMLSNLLSSNPIHSWIKGGYYIETPFYREPGLTLLDQLVYESLRASSIHSSPIVNKSEGKGSLEIIKQGTGIEFFTKYVKDDTQIEEITFELEMPDNLDTLGYESQDELLDLDDDASLEINYGEEDDLDTEVILSEGWD